MEATRNFQRVNAEYKERHRNNLARQIRIANRDATDEEIDAIIEDPNFSEANFFAKRLMYASSAAQTAQSMYDEIKETRDDLLKLETDMNELSSVSVHLCIDRVVNVNGVSDSSNFPTTSCPPSAICHRCSKTSTY